MNKKQKGLAAIVFSVCLLIAPKSRAEADQQLVFDVHSHKIRTAKSAEEAKRLAGSAKASEPIVEDSQYAATITLGDKYFILEDDKNKTIYNLKREFMYGIPPTGKKYVACDLHAILDFSLMEFQNRKMLAKVLQSAGAQAGGTNLDLGNRFALESLFGVSDPAEKDKIKVDIKTDGEKTLFMYDGIERASYMPSQVKVEDPYKKAYVRALAYLFKIHPSIREELEGMNVPKEFKYSYSEAMETESLRYELKDSKTVASSEPTAPKDFSVQSPPQLVDLHEALDKLGTPKLMDEAEVDATMEVAMKKGNYLEALLAVLEYPLTAGRNYVPSKMEDLKDKMRSDKECEKFMADYTPKKSKDDVKKQLDSLESIDQSKLRNGYMVDIMRANDYEVLGDTHKARELFFSVLKRRPFIAGVYHDLGMNYFREMDMFTAWDCFSMADKIAPDHFMMASIRQMEAKMEREYPDFF